MNHKASKLLFLVAAVAMLLCLTSCGGDVVKHADHLEDYVRTMDYEDGFTILQLSDIHWHEGTQIGDAEGTYGSKAYLTKLFKEVRSHAGKIDLVELTGDLFMLTNTAEVTSFIEFMESEDVPYAVTWGNHDRHGMYNPNWISEQFKKAPHCVYAEIDKDDVHERGNFVINLQNADKTTAWQVVNLDSGASYRKGAMDLALTYDFIREDQFAWMEAEHEAVGEQVPVIAYYHIAQKDATNAFEAISAGAEGYKQAFFKLEGFGSSKYCNTTEEAFLKCNVKAAFMGHCHANDWTYTTPSGITYGFGVKTTPELYYGYATPDYKDAGFEVTEKYMIIGASLVTLNDTEGDFTLEHLYFNEREPEDFVLWRTY